MPRAVLLDTNILIGAFDGEDGNMNHELARQRLKALLEDDDVKLSISPLIRYEVLRGARNVPIEKLDEALSRFQEFDTRGRDARRAAEIFRLAKEKNVLLNKRTFDVFHCVCAELNNLELASQDGDIPAIQNLMNEVYPHA